MRNLLAALKGFRADPANDGRNPVVPDIKAFSPKDGDLLRGRDPAEIARQLEACGAPALSTVTEEKDFHGSLAMLTAICQAVSIPVLRKDFIHTVDDLKQTVDAGAAGILLMYACLERRQLEYLYEEALKLGLTPLVETHTAQELEWALELAPGFLGVNNRDIQKLERDDGTVNGKLDLLSRLPKESYTISESSIRDAWDVRRAIAAGADAALVGTAVLSARDPGEAYRRIARRTGLKLCGCMTPENVQACAGADLIGIVVNYPKAVPWNISPEEAAPLLAQMPAGSRSAVVTGGSPDRVCALAERLRPDCIQLHYQETLADTDEISRRLAPLGIDVIRSVSQNEEARLAMFGCRTLADAACGLNGTACGGILFDSRDASNAEQADGEMGLTISDDLLQARRLAKKPVLLGGGITGSNALALTAALRPDYIDVMTGSEDAPGQKNPEKISSLLAALA